LFAGCRAWTYSLTSLIKKSYIEQPDHSKTNQIKSTKNDTKISSKPKSSAGKNLKIGEINKERQTKVDQPKSSEKVQRPCRQTVFLSCLMVFHATCLKMFDELSMKTNKSCPVCISKYQKKILVT
jgi:hypothetical protein